MKINFVITLSKRSCRSTKLSPPGSTGTFIDNVMKKFIINNWMHEKLISI